MENATEEWLVNEGVPLEACLASVTVIREIERHTP